MEVTRRSMVFILHFVLHSLLAGYLTAGFKITEVSIPKYTDLRRTVQMSCKFDITRGKLYSVKWYKDEFEFFRYMPDNKNHIQTFPVPGVYLDVSRSNRTTVTLHSLSFQSSGNYRCEMSKDGPNFETSGRNGNMTVIVYPDNDPTIAGLENSKYSIGDYVTGNCTSSQSNPVANLSWYINNQQAESWLLEKYPISNVTVDSIPLFSRSLGLRFRLEKSHFTQNDRVELRCSARIADLAVRETTALITNAAGPINDGLQAQNRVNRSNSVNDGKRIENILFFGAMIVLSLSATEFLHRK